MILLKEDFTRSLIDTMGGLESVPPVEVEVAEEEAFALSEREITLRAVGSADTAVEEAVEVAEELSLSPSDEDAFRIPT